ncbi:carotenoid biosynthesis protein [Paenisporosarcina antarctica]|uniref:Carotenoid biosynthesis protein n=1 Tax=Paenisporosarcina antarctica TaxID=417367 RepID=A0A4P6ZTP2_9BACL|nr:carotenoid biosynthesis protein [Paenisporosarcina antarctica]QBP39681.1 carotenoid biosynthesis protein [Paenisporosarcina antarctica]
MKMKVENLLFKFFIIWYICGVILLSFDLLPLWLEWSNVMFLFLAGLLACIYFLKLFGWKFGIAICSVIFVFSFSIEYLGAAFGVLFGDYSYTDRFTPNLFDVPIAIGFAWLMVMGTSHAIATRIVPKGNLLRLIIGASIAVVIDLIIDPVAFKVKQYWIWDGPGMYYDIPFSNFVGWFIVAFLLHVVIFLIQKRTGNIRTNPIWEGRMILLFGLIVAMFVLLGLIGQLWLASSLTSLLTVVILIMAYKRRII